MEYQSRHIQGVICIALGLGLSSCGVFSDASSDRTQVDDTATYQTMRSRWGAKTLESNDEPIELLLPRGWQEPPPRTLHPSAQLDAYNPDREIFLVVVGEDRSKVQFNQLTENAAEYRRLLTRGFSAEPKESRTTLERVDGYPAIQYEIQGQVNDRSVVYLHTTVEVGSQYYQIVLWTPEGRYAENAEAMKAIVQDLRFETQ